MPFPQPPYSSPNPSPLTFPSGTPSQHRAHPSGLQPSPHTSKKTQPQPQPTPTTPPSPGCQAPATGRGRGVGGLGGGSLSPRAFLLLLPPPPQPSARRRGSEGLGARRPHLLASPPSWKGPQAPGAGRGPPCSAFPSPSSASVQHGAGPWRCLRGGPVLPPPPTPVTVREGFFWGVNGVRRGLRGGGEGKAARFSNCVKKIKIKRFSPCFNVHFPPPPPTLLSLPH